MQTTAGVAGAVLAGRRLERLLGHGGEGEVWRARRGDGSVCALKLVRPSMLPDADEVRRRGAWLVRIDHPHLVRVRRGGRITRAPLDGWGYVEMDLVEGESLASAPADPWALAELAPVAEALDLLHAGAWSDGVPLVHRDVKPANLIAAPHGLVLVDPSTLRGLDTTDLTRVGTPVYLAPEVTSGRFGPLADVYSLAATAAALLTGARGQELATIVADPWAHDLPDSVRDGLAPDPQWRPGTCAAVVEGRPVVRAAPIAVDDGRDVAELPIDEGRRLGRAGRWTWLLGACLLGPAGAWAAAAPWRVTGIALAVAVALHLLASLVTGRAALGLVAPPAAWALLIGERVAAPRARRRWAAGTVLGTLLAGAAAAVLLRADPAGVLAVLAASWLLVAVTVAAAGRPGIGTGVLRTLLLPLWLPGATLLRLAGRPEV